MDSIRNILGFKHLEIDDYFNFTFEIFKDLVKQNKLLMGALILISFLIAVSSENSKGFTKILEFLESSNLKILEQMWLFSLLTMTMSVIYFVTITFFLKKTSLLLKDDHTLEPMVLITKSIKISSVIFVFAIVLLAIFSIGWIILIISYFIMTGVQEITTENLRSFSGVNLFICTLGIVFFIFIIANILYFPQAYLLRRITIYEAFKYNLHLCKGNRLKIIFPLLLLIILRVLLSLPMNILSITMIFSSFKYLIMGISSIILPIFDMFTVILISVIYLNVEYVDLKK